MNVPMKQVGVILAIVLTAIIVAILAPIAISALSDVNQTGWDTTTIALWSIILIVVIIAIVLAILDMVGKKS